jgi:hypothetical protein
VQPISEDAKIERLPSETAIRFPEGVFTHSPILGSIFFPALRNRQRHITIKAYRAAKINKASIVHLFQTNGIIL